MKEEKRIMNVFGQVDEKYIEEAAPGKKTDKKLAWVKWASIAACFTVLAAAAFPLVRNDTMTPLPNEEDAPPSSTAVADDVTPPIAISANGLHLVQLACEAPTASEISTDFIIHVNPKAYTGREENGAYVIRPVIPMSEGLTECSLKIYRIAGVTPADAADSIEESLATGYLNVGDITDSTVIDGLFLHADNGSAWDAEQVDVTITDDLMGGSYILEARYFTEATEGHGTRFADMVGTFKAVTSADAADMPAYLVELYGTISDFTPAFFTDDTSGVGDVLAQDAQIYTYGIDVMAEIGIASIDYKISGDENPTAAIVSVKHRISTEDSYNYLTIELTYSADGGWAVHFAGVEK